MARLNQRPSNLSTATTRQQSGTPQPHFDQENMDPNATPGRDKIVPQRPTPNALPTPPSAEDVPEQDRGQKRKRAVVAPNSRTVTPGLTEEEEQFTKYFDPYQDAHLRRDVRKRVRELDRTFRDRRDELLQDDGVGLVETVRNADALYAQVKQTGDATLDSRLLVDVSDLAYKRSAALALGSSSTGVDVDEFLSKAITYMRNHGHLQDGDAQPTQSNRRRSARQDDDDDDDLAEVESYDWEFFGRNACYPASCRAPARTFLLGPLSVEKKRRAQTQRRARNARDANVREAKPEAITQSDLTQSNSNSLTAQCKAIRRQLKKHVKDAVAALRDAGITNEDLATQRGLDKMRELRLQYIDNHLGAPLLEYVINPRSFAQTIENIFYASFLIKEGSAGIILDEDGLPVLFPSEPRSIEQQRAEKISKHQTVISLDYGTWQDLIHAYNITEPMIPHREEEEAQLGTRGWYG